MKKYKKDYGHMRLRLIRNMLNFWAFLNLLLLLALSRLVTLGYCSIVQAAFMVVGASIIFETFVYKRHRLSEGFWKNKECRWYQNLAKLLIMPLLMLLLFLLLVHLAP